MCGEPVPFWKRTSYKWTGLYDNSHSGQVLVHFHAYAAWPMANGLALLQRCRALRNCCWCSYNYSIFYVWTHACTCCYTNLSSFASFGDGCMFALAHGLPSWLSWWRLFPCSPFYSTRIRKLVLLHCQKAKENQRKTEKHVYRPVLALLCWHVYLIRNKY